MTVVKDDGASNDNAIGCSFKRKMDARGSLNTVPVGKKKVKGMPTVA